MKPIGSKKQQKEKIIISANKENKEPIFKEIPEASPTRVSRANANLSNPTDKHLIEVLVTKGPLTRNQLMKETKIARSTIYDSLLRLILKKYVSKFSEKPQGPGRPKVFFHISEDEPSSGPAPMLVYT